MEKTLVAIDNSGSTNGMNIYWRRVGEILRGSNLNEAHYILWNSNPWGSGCNFVGQDVVDTTIAQCRGRGGTCPVIVAHALQARHFDRLILITDGQVTDYDVQSCDADLSRLTTPLKSECYIIATSWSPTDRASPNLSVTCPFSRLGETVVRTYTDGADVQTVITLTAEDRAVVNKVDAISTYQELNDNYTALENALTIQNMGREDTKMRDRLLAMQSRILRNMAKDVPGDIDVLKTHLETGDVVSALSTLKQVSANYYDGVDDSPMTKLNHLVSLCSLKNQYNVSAIRSNRAARATTVQSTVAVPTDDDTQKFECPISCDNDEVVLLVRPGGGSLLNNVNVQVVDELTNWPFHLCRYENLFSQIGNYLGHPIGHKTAMQLMVDDMPNPFTREPLIGYICTGQNHSHVKATNWVLAQIFTGGKSLGSFDMWYAILVYYIKFYGPSYLRNDADLITALEGHLIYRLKNRNLNLNLMSLPEYVNKLAPGGVCLWSTLHSTLLKKSLEWDATLSHVGTFDFFYYCLGLINYPLHPDVKARNSIIGAVVLVMSPYNKTHSASFADAIRALYQNHIWYPNTSDPDADYADGTYVFLDGPPTTDQINAALARMPVNLRSRSVDEILTAYRYFDAQKRLKDVTVDNKTNDKTWVKNYNYHDGAEVVPVPICPTTMRPYYTVGNGTWVDASIRVNGPLSGQISANAHYINYCTSRGKYPTEEEFIKYCYDRQSNIYRTPTLPAHMPAIWRQILVDYGTLPPIEVFVERANASVSIVDRIRMESTSGNLLRLLNRLF